MSAQITEGQRIRWYCIQGDLSTKFESGSFSPEELQWWMNQPKRTRIALIAGKMPPKKPRALTEILKKFALELDLGIFTVPDDYHHSTSLSKYAQIRRKNDFRYRQGSVTDENFKYPTRILKPGDKLRVRVFRQVVEGVTFSQERIRFLTAQKAVYVGAQGAILMCEWEKFDLLQKERWYTSFDIRRRLPSDEKGFGKVPSIYVNLGNQPVSVLLNYEYTWDEKSLLLCFTEPELEPLSV